MKVNTMAKKPTEEIRDSLNELCEYNNRTQGGEVGNMYLGKDIFVAEIRYTRVIDGDWDDLDTTVDMVDLIELHKRERGW